jgi:glycosyltransferase involved in cell wall biosynthesis
MSSARPHIDRTNVAALLPAYFEERAIGDVAKRACAQLDLVLVVDDGSTDATSERAKVAGARVVRHEKNKGKGAAIQTGFKTLLETPVEYILILDSDGQHLPEEIGRFLEEANRSGADVVVGSRMSDTRTMPLVRKLTNLTMSWIVSRVCGQRIDDSQSGFRMIHRSVVPHLFCETQGFDYESEMLFIAAKKGFKISSVPISTVYGDEKSKIHPVRDTIRFFQLLARYR